MNWFGKIFSNKQKEQEDQERRLAEEQQREKNRKPIIQQNLTSPFVLVIKWLCGVCTLV